MHKLVGVPMLALLLSCTNGASRCKEDRDCANSLSCNPDGICAKKCVSAFDCKSGEVCRSTGFCASNLLSSACDDGCAAGQECHDGRCECTSNSCDGCCLSNACLDVSNSNCGKNGSLCEACGGATPICDAGNGVCKGICDPAACGSGCCTSTSCELGTADIACGNASACVSCATSAAGHKCIAQKCGCSTTLDCPVGTGCSLATGTCVANPPPRTQGQPCTPGDTCTTGICADGYCCNSACMGVCAACDVAGSLGTCTAVASAPHGARSCMGIADGPCSGFCDGVTTTACLYPVGSCPPAGSCTAGVGTLAGVCSMGACESSQVACADQLCGATACATVSQVAAGNDFVCALTSQGVVYCWGANWAGQLGVGDTNERLVPTQVTALSNVRSIATGEFHACAVMNDNSMKCWGTNSEGQLGIGVADSAAHHTPTPVCATGSAGTCVALAGVSFAAGGPENTCAAMTNQRLMCWGTNLYGQVGDGTDWQTGGSCPSTPSKCRYNPTQVCATTGCGDYLGSSGGGFVDVSLGYMHVCALQANTVFCWGYNNDAQVGLDDNVVNERNYPYAVTAVNDSGKIPIRMAVGAYHSCAVISDGTPASNVARCWGWGPQRGDDNPNNTTTEHQPVTVCSSAGCGSFLTGVTAIAGGDGHTCAIAGGAVHCWGTNNRGQLGTGATGADVAYAVPSLITAPSNALGLSSRARGDTTCARIQTGGTLRCWGDNSSGQIGNGAKTANQATPVKQTW
ncbi:MAG: hypothetical protein IT381_01750 [Deltaproteobacteria bacterium]|nr:hypothetical protein [Deltaproteobacteria bacterium]